MSGTEMLDKLVRISVRPDKQKFIDDIVRLAKNGRP